MRKVYCVGYTPRPWDPRYLQAILECPLYFEQKNIFRVVSESVSDVFISVKAFKALLDFYWASDALSKQVIIIINIARYTERLLLV